MENKELKIEGMSCQHCVMAVKSALKKFELKDLTVEIGKVKFDPENKDVKSVVAAIEEEGYKVVS